MRRDERILNEALVGLSDEQRIRAWVDAVRRAGGLNFAAAGDEVRQEILDIEQSMVGWEKDWFLGQRDKALAANAMMSWVLSWHWWQAEAILSRMAALLSLIVIVKAKDTREVLSKALAVADEDNAELVGAEASNELSDREIVGELASFCGAMFAYDDSPLRHYWAEALKASPIQGAAPHAVDLRSLVQVEAEPIQRVLTNYGRDLACNVQVPETYMRELARKPPVEFLSVAEVMLPPVDVGLERNSAMLRLLKQSRLAPRISKAKLTDDEIGSFRKVLGEPRTYAVPVAVISSFEKWLYPDKKRYSQASVRQMWDDYMRKYDYEDM